MAEAIVITNQTPTTSRNWYERLVLSISLKWLYLSEFFTLSAMGLAGIYLFGGAKTVEATIYAGAFLLVSIGFYFLNKAALKIRLKNVTESLDLIKERLNFKPEIVRVDPDFQLLFERYKQILSEIKEVDSDNVEKKLNLFTQLENINGNMEQILSHIELRVNELGELLLQYNEYQETIQNINESITHAWQSVEDIRNNANHFENSINQINQAITKLTEAVKNTYSNASSGEHTVEESLNSMTEIAANSMKIRDITSMINSISEKTNMLSLNASIEAARAGEAGRGFAVVADEIAKLADRTVRSVGQIQDIIETTDTSLSTGLEKVKGVNSTFKSILSDITHIQSSSESIMQDLESQIQNSNLIIQSVGQLADIASDLRVSAKKQQDYFADIRKTLEYLISEYGTIFSDFKTMIDQTKKLIH